MAATKTKKPNRRRKTPQRFAKRRRTSIFTRLYDTWQRRQAEEFRPDSDGTAFLKLLHMTSTQRNRILRWSLYCLCCLAALLLQDVIMSRVKLFHATTDLPVTMILLITVLEGSEIGGIFALITSIVYFFSGSAPGAYSVGFIVVFGILTSLFRQRFWHRSSGSIILCTTIAIFLYELGIFGAGLFSGLTRWSYFSRFVFTAIYSSALLIPLYPLALKIGRIGGHVWKE